MGKLIINNDNYNDSRDITSTFKTSEYFNILKGYLKNGIVFVNILLHRELSINLITVDNFTDTKYRPIIDAFGIPMLMSSRLSKDAYNASRILSSGTLEIWSDTLTYNEQIGFIYPIQ